MIGAARGAVKERCATGRILRASGPAARAAPDMLHLKDRLAMPTRIRRFSESLPMLLLKAREVAMDYFRPALHAQGITEQQWRVLRALNEVRETSASGLAAECLILAPSITRMLRKLAGSGLVAVRNSTTDRRELRVKLTRKGKRMIDVIGPLSERQYDLIRDRMHPERMALLYELLHDFIARKGESPKP